MLNSLTRRAGGALPNRTMISLLVVLLVLLCVALFLVAGLLYLRYRRRARKQNAKLPPYENEEKRNSSISTTSSSSHRRVMVRPQESVYVYQEKQNLIANSSSPPPSPLPEIHITFPEEYDDSGKRTSGRVVVVRVGDNGVGLEPVEGCSEYRMHDDKRFESLDLDRVGGLVEKARNASSYDKYEKL